jgi:hypothetical protein
LENSSELIIPIAHTEMKGSLVFLLLIWACKQPDNKPASHPQDSIRIATDTVIRPPVATSTDHAAWLKYLDSTMKHIQQPTKIQTDTVINEYSGRITYEIGPLFSQETMHAVVNVHDGAHNPVYVYKKDNGKWTLIHTLNEIYNLSEYPVKFKDINFDGYKDLIITWYYLSGRCNCWGEGCMNVYLYNPATHSLVENHEIPGYLDIHIYNKERALYLGNHCEGIYRKFKWNRMEMLLIESYEFTPPECWFNDEEPCKIVHRIHRNGMITEDTLDHEALPAKWRKIFHDD